MLYLLTLILTKSLTFKQIIQTFITFIIIIISIKSYKSYLRKSKNIQIIHQTQLQSSLKFKTILIFTSSLSSLPLHLIQSLSAQKTIQLILILPPTSNHQTDRQTNLKELSLINLLRESNPQLFLERCDLSNPISTIKFIQTLIKSLQTQPQPFTTTSSMVDPLKSPLDFKLHSILFFQHHHFPSLSQVSINNQTEILSSPLLILQLLLPFLLKSSQSLPIKIIPIYPIPSSCSESIHTNKSISLLQSFQQSLTNSTNPPPIPLHILPVQIPQNQFDFLMTLKSLSPKLPSLLSFLSFLLKYPILQTSNEVINDLLYMLITPPDSLPAGKLYKHQCPITSPKLKNEPDLLFDELDRNSNLIKSLIKSSNQE